MPVLTRAIMQQKEVRLRAAENKYFLVHEELRASGRTSTPAAGEDGAARGVGAL